MIYTIETKADFSGAVIEISFPEDLLDLTALYTIQADKPAFLLPFSFCCMDGIAKLSYQLGGKTSIKHFYGSQHIHTVPQYVKLWENIIEPLLQCEDWFLSPYNFVLDESYAFVGKDDQAISYLYVPCRQPCNDMKGIQQFIQALSRTNRVEDHALGEKALFEIISNNFQPQQFLQMLHQEMSSRISVTIDKKKGELSQPKPVEYVVKPVQVLQKKDEPGVSPTAPQNDLGFVGQGDIKINIDAIGSEKGKKEDRKKKVKKEKEPQEKKEKKPLFSFGSKKKEAVPEIEKRVEVRMGAGSGEPMLSRAVQPKVSYDEDTDATQIEEDVISVGPCLKRVGDTTLPLVIDVSVAPGQVFTICRFDSSVGEKQSDFEFAKDTKEVSRRHALIERNADGSYCLYDRSSRAGTFVNGERLTPNVPVNLQTGYRISFGRNGADYVWEE